jgi:hypothetical protein
MAQVFARGKKDRASSMSDSLVNRAIDGIRADCLSVAFCSKIAHIVP